MNDYQGFRDGNFKHLKLFVGHSRNGTVGHCLTSLQMGRQAIVEGQGQLLPLEYTACSVNGV